MRRIFLAVPLGDELKDKLQRVHEVNAGVPKVIWTKRHNLHITVYFIGSTAAENVPPIIEKIKTIFFAQSSLTLQFLDCCLAPPGGRPRMVWARFLRTHEFTSLSRTIHETLAGFTGGNPFYYKEPIPHITLARFNHASQSRQITIPQLILPEIKVPSCTLFESVPTSRGVSYEPVEEFPLAGGDT